MAAYCGFLLRHFFFLGTGLGSVFLGLAISVHASSVIDLVFSATQSHLLRILYCVCYGGLVALVVYWPAGVLASSFAVPVSIMHGTGLLQPGDVVIYNRSAYRSSPPQPGDVVVYEMASTRFSSPLTRLGGHQNVIYQLGGRQIDRILAGPGQHVKARDGKLEVDGEPATRKPLNPSVGFQAGELTLPSDSYFIVPSEVPYLNGTVPSELWSYAAIVPAYEIAGKVYLRNYPLRRFAIVR